MQKLSPTFSHMKLNYKIILSSLILMAALAIVMVKLLPNEMQAGNASEYPSNSRKASREVNGNHQSSGMKTPDGGHGNKSENQNTQDGVTSQNKDAIIARIQTASTTYNAAYLPVIKPYLVDADPEIRKEALNGMLVLGDSAAGPMFREAAKQMTSDIEAKALLDAAAYIELPPVDINELLKRSRDAKKSSTPQPTHAPVNPE